MFYLFFLQWLLVAVQEFLRIWGGEREWRVRLQENSLYSFQSLVDSMMTFEAQNYSNIEKKKKNIFSQITEKQRSLDQDFIKE